MLVLVAVVVCWLVGAVSVQGTQVACSWVGVTDVWSLDTLLVSWLRWSDGDLAQCAFGHEMEAMRAMAVVLVG